MIKKFLLPDFVKKLNKLEEVDKNVIKVDK